MSEKPEIVATGSISDEDLETFKTKNNVINVVNIHDQQVKDLETIHYVGNPGETWVYYPWTHSLLHCVDSDALFALRTNRNKLLITADEQESLRGAVIGIVGMSVGSGIALATVYSGMSDTIKIADRDTLDTSNLNRLRESLLAVGQEKTKLASHHIYEINPFASVHDFSEGITTDNIDAFFDDPKLSVVIDEIDDFKMKIQLRFKAREKRITLLMLTSLGDNILIDIERYDIDHDLEIFNGQLGGVPEDILANPAITPEDIQRYSVQLVGAEYIPTRALESVAKMGAELVGRPQLYSTIGVDGGLAAYIIRQILLNADIKSGRYFVAFADFLDLKTNELYDTPERQTILQKLNGS